MPASIYKVVELVGTSDSSWEDSGRNAVQAAGKSLSDLRGAQVDQLDMKVENGKVVSYRAKVRLSFKFEPGGQ